MGFTEKWNLDATFKFMHLHNYDVNTKKSLKKKLNRAQDLKGNMSWLVRKITFETEVKYKVSINLKLTLQRWGNLHLTITITVWLTASPTPLKAVQRYVPLELLLILAMTKYPSSDCSAPLSVPFSHTLVQVIFGSGLPVALQLKVTSECSQTSWSLVTPTTWGRSTNNQVIKED